MFPSLPSPTKLRNDRSRKRLIEIITTILKNRDGQPVRILSIPSVLLRELSALHTKAGKRLPVNDLAGGE